MEMELQHTCLTGFQTVLDQILIQEETLESIVPDACPDILRIVDADGEVCLKNRDLSEGNLRVGGSIRTTVLYLPDGEDGPRHIEVRIPFVCSVDHPGIHTDVRIIAAPRLCSVDARAVNPRKVLVRAELAVAIQVYAPSETELCCGVSGAEEQGLQQRCEERQTYLAAAVAEKPFTFSDVLNLPPSKPRAEELLRSRIEPHSLDAKVIGSKLIVKGETSLQVLYRTAENEVCAAQFELPFSQIIELNSAHEEADVMVEPVLVSADCSLQPGDPGSLAVSLELLAQAAIREQQAVSVVSDLYCTQCPVEVDRTDLALDQLVDVGTRRQTVRQFCECGIPVKSVIACSLRIGRLTQSRTEHGVSVTADTQVQVLFLSEEDALCAASFAVPAICELAVDGDAALACRCLNGTELSATPVTGGLELRFTAEFSYFITAQTHCLAVEGIRPLPQPEGSGAKRPSVVLRVVSEGETLWDIAKACGATVPDIMSANQLEQESAPAGMLLLIPKQR